MPDLEKVMLGLEICYRGGFDDCKRCPYDEDSFCREQLCADALALLKEQEAECELDERCEDCKEYDKEKHYCPRFCRIIRTTLDEVKGNEPRWIPVTERLPEEGVSVIAYEEQGFPYIDWICDGEWFIASNENAEVTHWMPLPEPPKEPWYQADGWCEANGKALEQELPKEE